jgi:hypothetical protein
LRRGRSWCACGSAGANCRPDGELREPGDAQGAAGVEREYLRAERVAMCCSKEMGVKDWEKMVLVVPKVVLRLGGERRRKEGE